ncbi:cupin domain-containing protein [Alicyclobacillus sp. SO9]|uniref:cupin domain-containing protein n=1 Tax=Alicyclobacillus sp. SO9 TaxID=2665646 RepID=UPI0018E83977|nr:cupin domain-containing protein [Alicyclobacillus sp. SO9]QQE77419.1 cupin domain-containing protein [Alicyclobacillus sp. SO9]
MVSKINLEEKFSMFHDYWHPRVAAELNDSYVKLAKLKGEFVWHKHENEDEMFYVISGTLRIRLRDGEIILRDGEFTVIPRGIEHSPVAEEEVQVLLLEPKSTLHTGNVVTEQTVTTTDWV